eukprot:g4014.t1
MPPVAYKRGWVASAPEDLLKDALKTAEEASDPQDLLEVARPEEAWELQGDSWVLTLAAASASELTLDCAKEALRISGLEGDRSVSWPRSFTDEAESKITARFSKKQNLLHGSQGWQLANACFFAGNVWAVQNLPRLDSRSAAGTLPSNYLTPAPYAFAIWGVIYSMELVFVVWQLLQGFGRCAPARRQLLKRLAPYWCGANACQIAWCFAFRPNLDTPGLLWISAVGLSGIAGFLSLVHRILSEAKMERGLSFTERLCAYAPWRSRLRGLDLDWPSWVKVAAVWLSLAAAGWLGTALTWRRRSALYGLTVSWAVVAVAYHTNGVSDAWSEEFPGGQAAILKLASAEHLLGYALIGVSLVTGGRFWLGKAQ